MLGKWSDKLYEALRRARQQTRRDTQQQLSSGSSAEVLELRMLLSAAGSEAPQPVDSGYFYWVDGRQVPLLTMTTTLAAVTASDTIAAESAPPTTFITADGSTRLWLTEQVYVGLSTADPASLFTADNGFSSYEQVAGTTDQFVATVTGGTAASLDAANGLYGTEGVAFSHPNFLLELQTQSNDPVYSSQWNLHNTGQTGGTADADVDAPEAWAITQGSPDIVVAVLDVGTQLNHPDLVNNLFVNSGEIAGNGIDDDGNAHRRGTGSC